MRIAADGAHLVATDAEHLARPAVARSARQRIATRRPAMLIRRESDPVRGMGASKPGVRGHAFGLVAASAGFFGVAAHA